VTAPQAATPTSTARPTAVRSRSRTVIEWAIVVFVALLAAFLIRTFALQPFSIPSGSMEPTLIPHDRVLVSKISYDLHGVHRGDVIVFDRPPGDPDTSVGHLIKRVIGLPGESISSGPAGEVFIDGQLIKQPWLTAQAKADPGPPIRPEVIPKGDYFVMGDNRGDSDDSREIGVIPGNLIVGKAIAIVWPLNRLGSL
jgi:signal peptidase I